MKKSPCPRKSPFHFSFEFFINYLIEVVPLVLVRFPLVLQVLEKMGVEHLQ